MSHQSLHKLLVFQSKLIGSFCLKKNCVKIQLYIDKMDFKRIVYMIRAKD